MTPEAPRAALLLLARWVAMLVDLAAGGLPAAAGACGSGSPAPTPPAALRWQGRPRGADET